MDFIPEPYCSTKQALTVVYRSIFPEPSKDEDLRRFLERHIETLRTDAGEIVEGSPSAPQSLANHTTLGRSQWLSPEERALHRRHVKMAEALRLERWLSVVCDSAALFDPIAFLDSKVGDGLGPVQGYALKDEGLRPSVVSTIPACLNQLGMYRRKQVEHTFREKLCAAAILAYYPNSQRGMIQFLNEHFWIDDKKAEDAFRRGSARHGPGHKEVKLRFDKRLLQRQFPPMTIPNDSLENSLTKADGLEHKSVNETKSGRPPKQPKVEEHLRIKYPNNQPRDLSLEKWRQQCEHELGEYFGKDLFRKARKAVY